MLRLPGPRFLPERKGAYRYLNVCPTKALADDKFMTTSNAALPSGQNLPRRANAAGQTEGARPNAWTWLPCLA